MSCDNNTDRPHVPRPVLLTGMPGSGKSVVGPLLAQLLGRPFIDLDTAYRRRHGRTAAAAIRTLGEAAFRREESALLLEMVGEAAVIACGGGTLTRPDNLAAALVAGRVVVLEAPPAELARRLGHARRHPLLAGGPLEERLRALWEARRACYRQAHVRVDTTGRAPWEVAFLVQRLLDGTMATGDPGPPPERFRSGPGGLEAYVLLGERSYPVHLDSGRGWGGLCRFADAALGPCRRVAVVDEGVPASAREELRRVLGDDVPLVTLPGGEGIKALARLPELVRALLERRVDRGSAVIAVGGGALLDAVGFAASVYMRGVRTLLVPTTLLAALDAGVGGKTALNLPEAKNVVGSFWQPRGVFVPLGVVLEEVVARGGIDGGAELLKVGLLSGLDGARLGRHARRLAAWRKGRVPRRRPLGDLAELVADGLSYKLRVVMEDEREEQGLRRLLNLGHTLAHMVEAASDYRVSHGVAVGLGLVAAAEASEVEGLAGAGLLREVKRLARAFGLWPAPPGLPSAEAVRAAFHDKKRVGDRVTLVLLRGPGEPVCVTLAEEGAKNLLLSGRSPILGL